MEKNNIVSLVISSLAIAACFYLYNQLKIVEQEMLLSFATNNEKVILQIKEILESEKVKNHEFSVTEQSVKGLGGNSTVEVKNIETVNKIENIVRKQQQEEMKEIKQQLAAISMQLSEKAPTENLSNSYAPEYTPKETVQITMKEKVQKTQKRQKTRDTYYESYWQAGVEDATATADVLNKLETNFSQNDNASGVIVNDVQCTTSSCKISIDYTLGKKSPLLKLRTQFLGKNMYFSESKGDIEGKRELTVYVTE